MTVDPRRPGAVLLDCDGVIVDSEPATDAVIYGDLQAHGLDLSQEEIGRRVRGRSIYEVADTGRRLGADLPQDWVETVYPKLYDRLREGVPLVDGILDLLDRLDAAGIPYAVGSNGSAEKMRITLGANDLLGRFDGRLLSAHDAGVAKPDPGLYLAVAERIGAPPADCVVIEDTPTGVAAAVAAGMRCIGYAERTPATTLAEAGAEPVATMAEAAAKLGL